MKLSRRQRELLEALPEGEWSVAPPMTSGQTVLALHRRGLIEMRIPERFRTGLEPPFFVVGYLTYTQYELRRVPGGV